jgi:hypothetical protein
MKSCCQCPVKWPYVAAFAGITLLVGAALSTHGQDQAQNQGPAPERPQRAVRVFVDGQAQIVEAFNNPDEWIREHVWVEAEFDSDKNGSPDRIKRGRIKRGQNYFKNSSDPFLGLLKTVLTPF